jgi:hypothetical protein
MAAAIEFDALTHELQKTLEAQRRLQRAMKSSSAVIDEAVFEAKRERLSHWWHTRHTKAQPTTFPASIESDQPHEATLTSQIGCTMRIPGDNLAECEEKLAAMMADLASKGLAQQWTGEGCKCTVTKSMPCRCNKGSRGCVCRY